MMTVVNQQRNTT